MFRMTHCLLAAFACLLTCTIAPASTIDFSTLSGSSGTTAPFTTYTENGYTVSVTSGSWLINNSTFGDPVPSIYTSGAAGAVSVVQVGNGLFTFAGVDLGEYQNNSNHYTITGLLAGSQVFTTTGQASYATFTLYGTGYSGLNIDHLIISFSALDGNVDNIALNSPVSVTPEPGSLALMLTGMAGAAVAFRRRIAASLRA